MTDNIAVLGKRRKEASMFLRNCWYVAAWSEEVTHAPLARTLLGLPVMLYRTEQGESVALEDRCCHRNLPLSLGFIESNNVCCGYHGLKFAPSGQCIEIPGQPQIPRMHASRAFR
jgi:phenylpropionate dioxygenase-like ring-hydroxylating dioxygenase large terminal subunit